MAHIAFLSSSVIDGTVYMTSHSLVELGLDDDEQGGGKGARRTDMQNPRVKSKLLISWSLK